MDAPTSPVAYPTPPPVERALDLLFPPVCVGCRRYVGRWICGRCWPHVAWVEEQPCYRCGSRLSGWECANCHVPSSGLHSIIAVTEFDGTAREAVHALKYENRHAIAGLLGRLMAQTGRGLEAGVVVPVPLHKSRRRERGYDQATLLAKVVAQSLDLPLAAQALRRTRPTKQQATLDRDDRFANVLAAFEATNGMNGERVLLIDDVATTGATMEAASTALQAAGAGPPYGLVFAHAWNSGRTVHAPR